MADDGDAEYPEIGQILEADAIENILARGQVLQVELGGEVIDGQRGRAENPSGIGKRFCGGVIHDQPAGPVGTTPDNARVTADIAAGDPVEDGWTALVRGYDSRG